VEPLAEDRSEWPLERLEDSETDVELERLRSNATLTARYVIHGLLAQTAMSTVYRITARDAELQCVLKIDRTAKRRRQSVRTEATLLSLMRHAALPQLRDVGELDDGRAYVVLEFVAGETIAQILAQSALPLHDALTVGRRVAEAVAVIHDAGYLHRDIKALNIIVPVTEGVRNCGAAVLLDLGFAAHMSDSPRDGRRTGFGTLGGTLAYMAPEQFTGARHTVATDVYALGATLFEMIFGRQIRSTEGILRARLADDPRVRLFVGPAVWRCIAVDVDVPNQPDYGAPVRECLEHMLRRAPAERPSSMGIVQQILERLQDQQGKHAE
jgi:eukaryotic-like serine/threonine-protein kinase